MAVKIYEKNHEVKSLTEKLVDIGKESKAIAVDARVLTSLIDKNFMDEKYLNNRNSMTDDKPEITVASRIDKNHLWVAFYKERNRIPIIFEYKGSEVERLYDLLK